ncbi:MAG: hypothetical protein ACKVX7_13575 [Planctomycetota bacterium]
MVRVLAAGLRQCGVLAFAFCFATSLIAAQVSREDGQPLSDAERAIAERFHATEVVFKADGRVSLLYDFESMDPELLADWSPSLDKMNKTARWSRDGEGSWRTVNHGLVIADKGLLVHAARWIDVTCEVDCLSVSGSRDGDLLAAVYCYDKGKQIYGSNFGTQLVRLTGRGAPVNAIPKVCPSRCVGDKRFSFGYRYAAGALVTQHSKRDVLSSDGHDGFLKKSQPGQAGICWSGRMQCFVFQVRLEGKLDEDWLKDASVAKR